MHFQVTVKTGNQDEASEKNKIHIYLRLVLKMQNIQHQIILNTYDRRINICLQQTTKTWQPH